MNDYVLSRKAILKGLKNVLGKLTEGWGEITEEELESAFDNFIEGVNKCKCENCTCKED